MEYLQLIVLSVVLTLAHYLVVTRHEGFWTVDGLFVPFQLLMSLGTLFILDPTNPSDAKYSLVICLPLWVYAVTSMVVYVTSARPKNFAGERVVVPYEPRPAIIALLFFAAFVTLAYYQAVGYNVFVLGIKNTLTGGTADYQSLRLESYSTSRYLYPGYVNQFKNVILPALSLVVVSRLYRLQHPLRHLIALPLVLISLIGVLGTGQRGAFVLISMTVLAFIYHLSRRQFARRALMVGGVVVPLFLLSTFINGRSQQSLQASTGSTGKLGVLVDEMQKRILYDNQFSGQQAFRYTDTLPTTHGQEWVKGVLGILPGNSGTSLPRDVFKYLYGTDRGTAPPSLWGSVQHDFGFAGLILVPVLLACIFRYISRRSTSKPVVNTLELVGMAGFSVVCGNWLAGGPEYLLNAGAVAFLGLWWIGSRQKPHVPVTRDEASTTREVERPVGVGMRLPYAAQGTPPSRDRSRPYPPQPYPPRLYRHQAAAPRQQSRARRTND